MQNGCSFGHGFFWSKLTITHAARIDLRFTRQLYGNNFMESRVGEQQRNLPSTFRVRVGKWLPIRVFVTCCRPYRIRTIGHSPLGSLCKFSKIAASPSTTHLRWTISQSRQTDQTPNPRRRHMGFPVHKSCSWAHFPLAPTPLELNRFWGNTRTIFSNAAPLKLQ